MIKFGQVTAYNEITRMATISYIRPDACEKCGGCNAMSQNSSITLKADCKEGDWVRVELPDHRFLSATAMAYVIPLILFVAGLLAGNAISGGSELWAVLGALIGLGSGLGCMKLCDTIISGRPEWMPHVAEVYDHKPDTGILGCGRE
jgi:positive regulator of sigma E activity